MHVFAPLNVLPHDTNSKHRVHFGEEIYEIYSKKALKKGLEKIRVYSLATVQRTLATPLPLAGLRTPTLLHNRLHNPVLAVGTAPNWLCSADVLSSKHVRHTHPVQMQMELTTTAAAATTTPTETLLFRQHLPLQDAGSRAECCCSVAGNADLDCTRRSNHGDKAVQRRQLERGVRQSADLGLHCKRLVPGCSRRHPHQPLHYTGDGCGTPRMAQRVAGPRPDRERFHRHRCVPLLKLSAPRRQVALGQCSEHGRAVVAGERRVARQSVDVLEGACMRRYASL